MEDKRRLFSKNPFKVALAILGYLLLANIVIYLGFIVIAGIIGTLGFIFS